MSRDCVLQHLLSDPPIAARIPETLGRRLAQMERRLSGTVFSTVLTARYSGVQTAVEDHQPGDRWVSGARRAATRPEQLGLDPRYSPKRPGVLLPVSA